MAKHMVKCRYCGKQFDRDAEEFVCPSKNWYYHKGCYAAFKDPNKAKEPNWIELIYDLIAHDLKKTYDFHLCEAQRKKMVENGRTNKGIYFALRYFYLIKNGEWEKGYGGIGIVDYIYEDSKKYWASIAARREGIMEAIEKQATAQAVERRTVQRKTRNTRQKEDFDEL